ADPAPRSPRIAYLWRQAEMAGDPADGIVDLAIFSGAEIKQIDLGLRMFQRVQDRVDAVVHVEIGFPLGAVAAHRKPRRIGKKLLAEIEYMTVRVALAQDRHEAEDPGAEVV